MDRNQEYIRLLQERNRMKKALSEKTDEEQQKEELERGFSINFRGANAVKQPNSKALDKPVVKVQKGLSADIARRLLGGNNEDVALDSTPSHIPTRKRWSADGDDASASEEVCRNRSTSALRRRDSKNYGSTNPRDDGHRNNIEGAEAEPSSISTSRKRSQGKSSPKGSSGVDDVLLTRIKSMNAEQKKALLDLLHISDPTINTEDDDNFADDNDSEGTWQHNEDVHALETGREKVPDDNTEYFVEDTIQEKEPNNNILQQNDNTIPLESVPTTARMPINYEWSKNKLIFRVKIFSTWDDCRNCVLQALRLRVLINQQVFDILQSLKLQICCGLNVLPTSMEVYRKFPVLVSSGHSSSLLEQWKGPVTLTQPLELAFEGYINEPENCVLSDHFEDMGALLQQMQLCIWNGFQEDSGVNYSPVKDMDVYYDGKCIWSGQVPKENVSVDVTKVSSLVSSPLKYESSASVVIPIIPTVKSQLPSSQHTSAKLKKEIPLKDGSDDDDFDSIKSKSTLKSDNIQGKVNDSSLDWLKSNITNNDSNHSDNKKDSLNFYVTNPRTGIKRANDIFFDSPPRPTSSSSDHDAFKFLQKSPSVERGMLAMIPDDAIPLKKAVSRGSRRQLQRHSQQQLDIIPESGDIPQSKVNIPSLNYTPSRQVSSSQLDDDVMLRRSLDAVQKAEKFNLNRLERTKDMDKLIFTSQEDALAAVIADAPAFARNHISPPPKLSSPADSSSNHVEDGVGSALSAKTTFSGEKPLARQPIYFSPASPTGLHKHKQVASVSPTSRLEKRAANIGEFSSKLSSTLNEVNGILAQLPRKPSVPLFPSTTDAEVFSSEVKNAIVEPSQSMYQVQSIHKPIVSVNNGIAPSGRVLCLWIFSTHGDNNYVGLNGIELFDEIGQYLPLSAVSRISAIPADLTIMPGYEDDPRKVSNLLDGVNHTKDDLHQWLAPHIHVASDYVSSSDQMALAEGKSLLDESSPLAMVRIEFPTETKLSMIRVYNFNKSRTHNQRGVKTIRIDFDGLTVYNGDVAKAAGQTSKMQSKEDKDCLSIPLCVDGQVLDNIAHQSQALQPLETQEEALNVLEESMMSVQSRPKTAAPPDDSLSQVVLLGDNTTQLSFHEESDPMLEMADGEDLAPSAASAVATDEQAIQDSLQASSDFLNAILQETDAIQMRSAYQQRLQQAKTASTTSLGSCLQQNSKEDSSSSNSGKLSANVSRPTLDVITSTTITSNVNTGASTVHYVSTLTVRHIRLELLASWGDSEYIGLGGIEVLNLHGHALRLTKQMLRCDTCMDADFVGFGSGGNSGDRSDLNQLLIAGHDTSNTQAMWLIPQDHDRKKIVLDIDLQSMQEIIGLKIWNYNGTTMDESLRGTKVVNIIFDHGRAILSNLLLRAGPLFDGIRFAQLITFDRWLQARSKPSSSVSSISNRIGGGLLAYITPRLKQTYEVLHPISGMSFVFSFFSNHGDHYYLGLDKMEFLDEELQVIDVLSLAEVTAVPYSVRDLANSTSADLSLSQDPRIPPAIFFESHSQTTPNSNSMQHSWLAPLARSMLPEERDACVQRVHPNKSSNRSSVLPNDNTLFVLAHFPVRIAAIRIWNYSKTPSRGVKDFCLSIDGNTIFMGSLLTSIEEKKVDALSRNEIPGSSRGQVILFSNETKLVNQFKDLVVTANAGDQDVLCINERQVMVRSKTMYQEPPSQIDIQQRPTTSFVRL